MTINVLVVDDSAVVRQVMSEILNASQDIQVYATAQDPIFAERHMQQQWPDVIVLDIEMPRMDGISFLQKIMKQRPTPVVICSSLAGEGTELAMTAISSGAIDIVTKPSLGVRDFIASSHAQICDSVRAAAQAKMQFRVMPPKVAAPVNQVVKDLASMAQTTDNLIAIGTSTGGTTALEAILVELDRTVPGIVVVQHMPEKFTQAFAKRLDSLCAVDVKEAESGDRIINGRVLIAPGGKHMEVQRSGAQYLAKVFSGPAVNRHCPSVDVLFRSVAKHARQNATGIIMTGMGNDGARGLLEMRDCGATTIAQDEATSIVFGMPKEAIKIGAASQVMSLGDIPRYISELV